MAVPDTTTFSLQDVVNAIGLQGLDSLQVCFDNANSSYFDPKYYVDGNDQLEFRNYGSHNLVESVSVSPSSYNAGNSGVSFTLNITVSPVGASWYILHPDWITVNPLNGYGDGSTSVTVSYNDSGAVRTGTIRVYLDSNQLVHDNCVVDQEVGSIIGGL